MNENRHDDKLACKVYIGEDNKFEKADFYGKDGKVKQTLYVEGKCDHYDENGRVKRTDHHTHAIDDPSDVIRDYLDDPRHFRFHNFEYDHYDVYTYRDDGKIDKVQCRWNDGEGTVSHELRYNYDKNGKLDTISDFQYDKQGYCFLEHVSTCDALGREYHSEHYDEEGNVIGTSFRSYNENGVLAQIKFYDTDEQLVETRKFDAGGRRIEESIQNADNKRPDEKYTTAVFNAEETTYDEDISDNKDNASKPDIKNRESDISSLESDIKNVEKDDEQFS